MKGHCQKLEIDAQTVIADIVKSIEAAKCDGIGAWQMQGIQRGYELLGRYLGMFHEKIDVNADSAIMEQLARGRRYAAGITGEDEEGNATAGRRQHGHETQLISM